jgi:hypothetical protein
MPIPSGQQKQRTECHSDGNSLSEYRYVPGDGGNFRGWSAATQLKAVEGDDQIGSWHVGHWIDHTHTAIRIRFDNGEDVQAATLSLLV